MKHKIAVVMLIISIFLCSCADNEPLKLEEGPLSTSFVKANELPISVAFAYKGELTEISKGENGVGDVIIQYTGWNGVRADFAMYNTLFHERYNESGERCPTIPDGAEIIVSFGMYIPAKIKLCRDTATFDIALPDGGYIEPKTEELTYSVTRDNGTSVTFAVDYGENNVLYHTLWCEWSNGNQILIAIAGQK